VPVEIQNAFVVMYNSYRRYFWNFRRYRNGKTASLSISNDFNYPTPVWWRSCKYEKLLVQKLSFTRNSHSGSLYIIHFAIRHRPTRGCLLPNNAGLISKLPKEVSMKIVENCRRRQPHYRLTPTPRGTPANVCTYRVFSKSRFFGLHFCRW